MFAGCNYGDSSYSIAVQLLDVKKMAFMRREPQFL
jgi:hypothetical protein